MKGKYILRLWVMLLTLLSASTYVSAQGTGTDEKVISFTSDNATMEDNPKQHNYNITIFSPDGEWKLQLNYYSDNMFGTFGNEDFRLSGDGRYFNFARNPKNDMVFYSFTDMKVSVADEGTLYRVKADCKTNGKYHFDVEATIAAPQPKDTICYDLGYARLVPNAFYGTCEVYAENDDYKLAYGIAGTEVLGTFYRADLLMPELTDKKNNKKINVLTATAVHTQEGERVNMTIDILSEELTLYRITTFNGPYEVELEDEIEVNMEDAIVQDLSEMYGCYQFAGQNEDYSIAVALSPETILSGKKELTKDDFVLPYTNIVHMGTSFFEEIYDIQGTLEVTDKSAVLKVDIMCMSGALYHVTMLVGESGVAPTPDETVNIDFGHLAMLDYSKGLGLIGLGGLVQDKYQIRAYLQDYVLDGEYTNDDFVLDLCDIMVVEGDKYVFHDAKYVTAKAVKQPGGRTDITIDMIGVDNVLYHATLYLDSLSCMHDGEYDVSLTDVTSMVGVVEGTDGEVSDYIIQIQNNMENVYDEDGLIVDKGYVFSFYFSQKDNSIAGEYGYSAGTMEPDPHYFYENGCEVRVAPVAGTLSIKPVEPIKLRDGLTVYHTWLYDLQFAFVGQNNVTYQAKGRNYLICINQDEELVNMDESSYDSITAQLAEQGLKVKKFLKGGKIIVEAQGKTFDLGGRQLPIIK